MTRMVVAFVAGWTLAGCLEFYRVPILIDTGVLAIALFVMVWATDRGRR